MKRVLRTQFGFAADSLAPPKRGEGWGRGDLCLNNGLLPMNLTLAGTSRCYVPACEAAGGTIAPRAVPTRFGGSVREISFWGILTPPLSSFGEEREKNGGSIKLRPVLKL